MDFVVFLMLNAVLFIQPGACFPVLAPFHVYKTLILLTLMLALLKVSGELSGRSLANTPINVCVIGLIIVMTLSEVARLRFETAWEVGEELGKVLIYYLLLVSLLDSPGRVRWLLRVLALSGVFIVGLGVLKYNGHIDIQGLKITTEYSVVNGVASEVRRLGTTSLFGDPNDCALYIDHCLFICIFLLVDSGGPLAARALWIAPMVFFGYALGLTQSRGGLMSLAAGLVTYLVGRYGRKAFLVGVAVLPVLLMVFAGRQVSIDLGGGTGQSRVQIWYEYLGFLKNNPILGAGWKSGTDRIGFVAHNTYLQLFGEHGFLAGTLFIAACYLAVRSFGRLLSTSSKLDPGLARLKPCLMAIVVSQVVGMMGLSRHNTIPTYTVLGLAVAYSRLAGVAPTLPSGKRLARHALAASLLFLLFIWVVIKMNLRYR